MTTTRKWPKSALLPSRCAVVQARGVFFLAEGLLSDTELRDRLLLRIVGSPDRYGKHIDGMGWAQWIIDRVIMSRSARILMKGWVRVPPSL